MCSKPATSAARLVGSRGYGERGGGEDDRAVGLEERGGKELRDVDGRGLQVGVVAHVAGAARPLLRKRADSSGGAALDPEDGVGVLRLEQELQMGGDVGGALAQAWGLVDVLQAVELALEEAEGVERAGIGVAATFQELGAVVEGHAAKAGVGAGVGRRVECGDGVRGGPRCVEGQRGEEEACALAQGCGGTLDGGGGGMPCAQHGLHIAGQLIEALGAEVDAEEVAGDVLQLVRLVEDHGTSSGQHACVGRRSGLQLDGHVGEEEVVVDDDDLGF
jgi:hypothetical protein